MRWRSETAAPVPKVDNGMTELNLGRHRGDYGYDAPLTGLLPLGVGGLLLAGLAAYHQRGGRGWLARGEIASSATMLLSAGIYVHTTRRGKFEVWAEILRDLRLRGDEQVLDMGCGRGAVMGMVARLVPGGRVTGLDL
ncbi:MAG TPA: hypothetical protein VGK33_03340, partial [Chloroflexota bacterium]